MRFTRRLGLSFRQFWENRSLLSVLLLEFIARTVLIVLFIVINLAAIALINQDTMQWLPSGAPDLGSLMNAKTYAALLILGIIEFIAILYVNSFFSAGYFGMVKNIIQDGSTTFAEFFPSAKRYWYATFRYLLPPYIIMTLAIIPFAFLYGVYSMVAAFGGSMDAQSLATLAIAFTIASVVSVIIVFWFSYGPAIIVFEDIGAWQAMRESFLLARRHFAATAAMTLTISAIIGIALALVYGINIGFAYLTLRVGSAELAALAQTIELLLNIVTLSAAVIAGLFVFHTYEDLTMRKEVRRVPHTRIKRT
jgi:hypothetical protein